MRVLWEDLLRRIRDQLHVDAPEARHLGDSESDRRRVSAAVQGTRVDW